MIERVAKAICPWNANKNNECPRCRVCTANAFAAIKAMREPTENMRLNANYDTDDYYNF